ncbi:WxL protein host-binding domain-containing protein, partial [Pseudolactococcus reticulitermitis]
TNINGVVEYSPNKIKQDKTLTYNLANQAKIPAEITLTPKSTQQVKVDVTMPNVPFSGVIAGGITFKEKDSDADKAKAKGISIQNKYAYVIALLMQQDSTRVAPNLQLTSAAPGQVNYRNVINANLQNPKAGYLNQMYVQATVKGVSNTSLVYTADKEMMQMAPNTNFDYPISIGEGKRIEPGKYQLTMTVYGQKDDNGQYSYQDAQGNTQKFEYKWQFTQDFTISGETARKLNARDVTVLPEPWYHSWMIWAGAVLVLLALFFLFFLLGKRRKDDEEEKDSAKKQAKKADKNSEKVAG